MAAICTSVVTAGCVELGSAADGGGEASSRQEEHLADPVTLDRWALVFVMLSPSWRANLLRPIASSPDRREACTCKRKSALTGGGSGGDPPTVKSER